MVLADGEVKQMQPLQSRRASITDDSEGTRDERRRCMDFGNPWAIISGLFIGLIGMGLFMHGKKAGNFKTLGAGVVMCAYPYFVTSIIALWGIFAVCLAGLWWWLKQD